jgi:hypothetical protein
MKTYYYVVSNETQATIVPAYNKERLRRLGFCTKSNDVERFETIEEAREYCENTLFFERNEVKFWS